MPRMCRFLHLIPFHRFAFQGADDAAAGPADAVGVHGLAHALIGGRVIHQCGNLAHYQVVVGAHQMHGAALQGLGALGFAAFTKALAD